MHDFRTIQTHVGPRTTSDLLFKGAVAGRSRSVYTGLIEIGHEAKGANAFQTNRNLKLSDEAWSESVPNLDIKTNDVRCSHASTVGPIDEDQRFYLESRGVPPSMAERLIVLGFFDEVLDQLPAPALVPELRAPGRRQARPEGRRDADRRAGRVCWPTWRPGRLGRSRSTVTRSRWSASATTSTPSATPVATPTSRSARVRC